MALESNASWFSALSVLGTGFSPNCSPSDLFSNELTRGVHRGRVIVPCRGSKGGIAISNERHKATSLVAMPKHKGTGLPELLCYLWIEGPYPELREVVRGDLGADQGNAEAFERLGSDLVQDCRVGMVHRVHERFTAEELGEPKVNSPGALLEGLGGLPEDREIAEAGVGVAVEEVACSLWTQALPESSRADRRVVGAHGASELLPLMAEANAIRMEAAKGNMWKLQHGHTGTKRLRGEGAYPFSFCVLVQHGTAAGELLDESQLLLAAELREPSCWHDEDLGLRCQGLNGARDPLDLAVSEEAELH